MPNRASGDASVALFHPGTQHSWQTATALQDLGELRWFATSIFHDPARFPYNLEHLVPGPLGRRLRYEFGRFKHPALDPANVRTIGIYEWIERAITRTGAYGLARAIDRRGNAAFADRVEKMIECEQPPVLWGFDGSSRQVFDAAKSMDRTLILDRTTPDLRTFRKVMQQIEQTHREWITTPERIEDGKIAQDEEEFALADVILCGSDYSAASIRREAGFADKLRVLPYCYDETLFASLPPPRPIASSEPVRFLFSGSIRPGKGAHHALEAIAQLPRSQAELTMVGNLVTDEAVFARYADRITHLPQVPRSSMPELMARHHVLVFPSYFEGAGLVLLEALAAGMAIIQTPNAAHVATADTGIILERPDTELLLAAMVELIEDRDRLNAMRAAAQPASRQYDFAHYRDNIAQLLTDVSA